MTDCAPTDLQVAICGSAGDGTIAVGDILKQAMARAGYEVIAFDLYPSEIRGFGKCLARARITSAPSYALKHYSDVLISLDDSHSVDHVGEVSDYGVVIYDDTPISHMPEGAHISAHIAPSHIPYGLALRELSERATGAGKSRNIVALGYFAGLYDLGHEAFHEIIYRKFASKAADVGRSNVEAFDLGYSTAQSTVKLGFNQPGTPPQRDANGQVVMMSGNSAVLRACLDAGMETFFGYPITPATSIMERLAVELPRQGGHVVQTEDEISAAAATIGAGYAGARAATATSGPGLALMTEILGLATMAEIPSVFFVSQRGGPSTGMPTKTEQSDLNLAVYGVAGDGQRIVLAPTNVEGCYRCAGKAFEMSEKYQTPVIVLLDLYLSNRYEAVELPAKAPFTADSSRKVGKQPLDSAYRRYQLTEDSISPRAFPGDCGFEHVVTGLEHDEYGHPVDTAEMHARMNHKRHHKLQGALEHPDFTHCKRFGDSGHVSVGLLAWGSSFGEVLEAMLQARSKGVSCAAFKVVMLSPFPTERVAEFVNDCAVVLVPELNYQGQFAGLVTAQIGQPVRRLSRSTGMPLRVDEIVTEILRLAREPQAAAVTDRPEPEAAS